MLCSNYITMNIYEFFSYVKKRRGVILIHFQLLSGTIKQIFMSLGWLDDLMVFYKYQPIVSGTTEWITKTGCSGLSEQEKRNGGVYFFLFIWIDLFIWLFMSVKSCMSFCYIVICTTDLESICIICNGTFSCSFISIMTWQIFMKLCKY